MKAGDLQPSAVSDLSLSKLKSNFSGGWTPHSHGHQLICSTFTCRNSHLYLGQADGQLSHYDVLDPEFKQEVNIEDGAVREVHIWTSEQLLVVSGDSQIHFFQLGSLSRVGTAGVLKVAEDNRHISSFGDAISLCERSGTSSPSTLIVVSRRQRPAERVILEPVSSLCLQSAPTQWRLWTGKAIVLETSGVVSVYLWQNCPAAQLYFQSPPNVMIMYRSPAYMFRDVVFCSTSAAAGLIVRTSFWLVGWQLDWQLDSDTQHGSLHRALEQDKILPQDEVWCLSLKRNLLLCGTESGCVILFTNNRSEGRGNERLPFKDFHLKKGHSVIELIYDCYKAPVFKRRVSNRPILSVDIGCEGEKVMIYYRTDIQNISCLTLKNYE